MVAFHSDNPDIEKHLRLLHRQVTENGGFVHDRLTIGCESGNFRIIATEDVPGGEKILFLPKACLLPHEKFDLALQGDDIVIKAHKKGVTKAQAAMMETMMTLYNLSGKIAAHRQTSSLGLIYKNEALKEEFMKGRNKEAMPFQKEAALPPEEFLLKSFFKTRVLGFRDKQQGKNDADDTASKSAKGGGALQVLMPIIDFINHHPQAAGFLTRIKEPAKKKGESAGRAGGRGVSVLKSCPVAGSDECFVSYGPYDAMDTFLNYNYVEKNAPFVRSIPLVIKLPGLGTIHIKSVATPPKHKNLADHLKDLAFFLPPIGVDKDRKVAVLGFLYIPQERAPRALRRVLREVLRQLAPGLGEADIADYIQMAEKRIITENLEYFTALEHYLSTIKTAPESELVLKNALDMARTQQHKIHNYPFFAEA